MKKKSVFLIVAAALAIVAIMVSIRLSKKESDKYLIGVIGPLSGEGASYGIAMKQGIEMAIEEINSRGGINGVSLEAVYEDDKLLPKEGVSAFGKLVSAYTIPVIIGSAASRVTLSIAPIAEQQKVVLISPISTTDELKDAGDYIFRNVPPNHMQGKTAAQFVMHYLKRAKAAILYKNDDYGSNLATSFREYFRSGGTIVFDESYEITQRDFRNVLSKLKQTEPEVVFMPGNYQDNALILKQAREAGVTIPFIGGDGAFSTELINLAGATAAEGSYYTMMGIPKSAEVETFIANFKKKYATSEEPNVFALYAYDAMMIIVKSIEMGGYSSEGIKNALYTIEYQGVTGLLKFDQYGEVDKPYSIYTVKDGKFTLLDWNPNPEQNSPSKQ